MRAGRRSQFERGLDETRLRRSVRRTAHPGQPMNPGFPSDLLQLLRCPLDTGVLHLDATGQRDEFVRNGTLRCEGCQAQYAIADGIVQLFDPSALDSVSRHEHLRRDQGASRDSFKWEAAALSQMEVLPVMESLQPLAGTLVLELGCGKGRFTTRMAQSGAAVLAMDFSLAVLQTLAMRLQPGWHVGLVQADCTKVMVAPRSFNRVLSTLVSNLPTHDHVHAMCRVAAIALSDRGRFVLDAHHHSLRERIRKTPQRGEYPDSGIFRYLFQGAELTGICRQHFEQVRCRPMQVTLPLLGRFGLHPVVLSRGAERLPLVNQLGELLLGVAEGPR